MIDDKDTHVVELDFDNKKFEKKTKESMSTLDKLKKKFSFSGVEDSIDQVSVSISKLEVVGITAIQNITNRVVNLGITMLKSLTVDNITRGWTKFGQKTTSVATMAAQSIKYAGKEIDNYAQKMGIINEQLEQLSWFSDETSYTFTDMVDNIGKFTAAGQDLDKSVKAMEGIATWAALSGQNATTASRAMYQLAQAMGKGKIQLIDWKSIQNANMDTQEFRKTVLETAVAMGELTKAGNTFVTKTGKKFTQNQFTEALDAGWFTSDVLTTTLEKYSSAIDEIYTIASKEGLTAAEVIEKYGDQLDQFGVKAFKAAQEARTFGDVINATIDAVSSKWMKTFELLIGGYDDAKKLWSNLADEFYDAFAESGNFRNSILEQWNELGGKGDLFAHTGDENQGAFWNIFDAIKAVVGVIRDAWNDIFPKTVFKDAKDQAKDLGNQLKSVTSRIQDFTKKLIPSEETLKKIRNVLDGIFSVLKVGVNIIKVIVALVTPIVSLLAKGLGVIFSLLSSFGEKLTDTIYNLEERFVDFIDKIQSSEKVFSTLDKIASGLHDTFIKISEAISKYVVPAIQKLVSLFTKLGGIIKSKLSSAFSGISSGIGGSSGGLLNSKAVGKQAKKRTAEASTSIGFTEKILSAWEKVKSAFAKLVPLFKAIGSALKSFANAVGSILAVSFDTLVKGFTAIKEFFEKVAETFKSIHKSSSSGSNIIKNARKPIRTIASSIEDISDTTEKTRDKAERLSSTLRGVLVIAITIGTTLVALSLIISRAVKTLGYLLHPLGEIADSLSGYIDKKALQVSIKAISSMIVSLSALMISMSVLITARKDTNTDIAKLAEVAGILAGLLVVIGAITIIIAKINAKTIALQNSTDAASKSASNATKNAKGFKAALSGLGSFFSSLRKTSQLAGVAAIVSALSTSIIKIAIALKVVAELDWSEIGKGVTAIGTFVVLLGAIAIATTKVAAGGMGSKIKKGYITILGISTVVLAFVRACQKLSEIEPDKLWQAVGALLTMTSVIGAIVIALAALAVHETSVASKAKVASKAASAGGKQISALTSNLGMMLAGFALVRLTFSKSIEKISALASSSDNGWSDVWQSLGLISVLLAEIGAIAVAINLSAKKGLENVAKVIMAFGTTMLILTASIAIMNKMDPLDSLKSIGLISTMLAGLALACHMVQSKDAKAAKGVSTFALSMSLAMVNLTASIAILNGMDIGVSGRNVGLLIALIASMTAACRIAASAGNKTVKSAAVFFASMTGALTVLIGCIAILSLLDRKDAIFGVTSLTAIILALSLFTKEVGKLSSSKGFTKSLLVLFSGFAVIAAEAIGLVAVMKMLSGVSWSSIIAVTVPLTLVIATIAGCVIQLGKAAKGLGSAKSTAKNLYSLVAAFSTIAVEMVALVAVMKLLSGVSWSNIVSVTVPLVSVIRTITACVVQLGKTAKSLGNTKATIKNLYSLLGAFSIIAAEAVGLTAAMRLLSGVSWTSILAVTVPLTLVIATIAKCVIELGKTAKGLGNAKSTIKNLYSLIGAFVLIAASMSGLVASLSLLQNVSWATLITATASMEIMLITMTAVIAALAKVSKTLKSATKLVAVVSSMILISSALFVFANSIKILASVPWQSLLIALGAVAAVLLIFAGVMAIIMAAGAYGVAGAAGLVIFASSLVIAATAMLIFSEAITVFAKAMEIMSEVGIGTIFLNILALAGAFTALGLVATVLMVTIPAMLALGAALTLIGIGLLSTSMAMQLLTDNIVPFCETVTTNIATIIQALTELASAIITSIVTALQEASVQIHELILTLINNLREDGDAIYVMLKDWIPKIIDLVNDLIKNVLQLIKENAKELIDTVFYVLELLLTALDQHVSSMMTKVLSIIIKIINVLTANAPKLVKSLINFLVAMITALNKNLGKLIKAIVQMVLKITGMVLQMAGTLIGTLLKDMIIFLAALCKMIPEAVEGIAYVFKETIKTCIGKILKFIGQVLHDVWSNLINAIKYLLGELWNGIVEGLASIFGNEGLGGKIGNWIRDKLSVNVDDQEAMINQWASGSGITEAARTATNNISQTRKDRNEDLAKSTREGVDAVQDAFNSAFGGDDSYDVNVNPVVDDSSVQDQLNDMSGDIDVSSDSSSNNAYRASSNMNSSETYGNSSGSSSNYSSTNTYNPTFNVYGVDDPKSFAEQVNMELSKMQKGGRLAHGS